MQGYAFSSWSGDASGTTSPATVTINSNKAVIANFTAIAETVSHTDGSHGFWEWGNGDELLLFYGRVDFESRTFGAVPV